MDENTPIQSQMDEAIPFIIWNDNSRQFEINEDCKHFLTSLKKPLGVVAVAGQYRTGKSYLLNRMLLDRPDGFGVGPTINPCTKGVWLWSKPMYGTTPDGEQIQVLIMDTEGLNAIDQDNNHDIRIFSLAILLASYFIYNSMGSIDENAIQSLNLVVNLTKHIQIKSSGLQEELDPQELSKYFPSFMWVVRDFTLQLVDTEGDPINSKEYLEKALQQQQGFSETVESKNRIRRLIKSFFTDRDCVTMIRPLTNEEALQNLIGIPIEELRPEFVEQVHTLRRKVLNRVKPKQINGKALNGTMFWNLCQSYVEAINSGAIPSIENSWSYICKNECLKAVDEAFNSFCQQLEQEIMDENQPLYDEELKDKYNYAKREALDLFNRTAVGEIKDQFLEQLKEKMKQRFNQKKSENDQACEQECKAFLHQNYVEIERALRNNSYAEFVVYLNDLDVVRQEFLENGPPGNLRNEILLEFCFKKCSEAGEYFLDRSLNEMRIQKTIAEDTVAKLQAELQEVKQEQRERMQYLEDKIRKGESEKAELAAKEQASREHYQQMLTEKKQTEEELKLKINNQKRDYERQLEEQAQKVSDAENQRKEIARQEINAKSEFDKQNALSEQKIDFLNKSLEESQKREREINTELKNCKKDFQVQNKEHTQQLEKQIKDLNQLNEELKEAKYELETKISDYEIQVDELNNKFEDQVTQKSNELNKVKESEKEWTRNYETLQQKFDNEVVSLKDQQENKMKLLEEKLKEAETNVGDKESAFEMAKQQWAKDEALYKQKQELAQFQLEEEKKKYNEQKVNHESMLKTISQHNRESVIGRDEFQQKVNEMDQQFIEERKKLDDQHNDARQRLLNDLEKIKITNNELELQLKTCNIEFEKSSSQIKEQLHEAETLRDEYFEKLSTLDNHSKDILNRNEEEYRKREQDLERQLDEKDAEIEDQIRDLNAKSEQQLNDLRRFFDEDKERIERRLTEQKTRFDSKISQMMEEHESLVNELKNDHEDNMNQFHDEREATEQQILGSQKMLEKEKQSLQERLDSTTDQLRELKENHNNFQSQATAQANAQSEKFAKERRDLNEKLDQLGSDNSNQQRTILQLENQKESLKEQILQREHALKDLTDESQQQNSSLTEKIEDLKQKYEKAVDDLTQSKINFERDKALKDQKIQFQEQRIEEYNEQQRQTQKAYEERIKTEKEEALRVLNDRVAREQSEKTDINTKYEQKRKGFKDLQVKLQQAQAQNEREMAVQREKHENFEQTQKDFINRLEDEVKKLKDENEHLNEIVSAGESGAREEAEQWKIKYYETDRQHSELQTEFEKDKALWLGKHDFQEKQKEQLKTDLEDTHRMFQNYVETNQKEREDQKNKNANQHQGQLMNIEAKYKKELRESIDQYQQNHEKAQAQIAKLEEEKKILNEKVELGARSRISEQGGLEKKLDKFTIENKRLTDELETSKQDRERKIEDMKRQQEREKELLKQKAQEAQKKSKDIEAKQTALMLSHETNRAKWDQEKSFIQQAKDDAIAEQKAMQRKYENLMKEHERLKEKSRRDQNWRYNKPQQVGGISTNNPQMYAVGKEMVNRLNLGGAGSGLGSSGQNELLQSTNNLNFGAREGLVASSARTGVDKSMDNLKLGGLVSKFNLGQNPSSVMSQSSRGDQGVIGGAVGAVSNRGLIDKSSMRTSNVSSQKSPLEEDKQ